MIRTLESQLLGMPAPIQCLLLQHTLQPPLHIRRYSSSTISPSQPSSPLPSPPLSFLPSPSNSPVRTPTPAPPPPAAALASSTALFTSAPAGRFLYSAPRFLNLPLNQRVPEICLLGRSNVGKSTLINALAGIPSAQAGRSHGSTVSSTSSRKHTGPGGPSSGGLTRGLAITSARAGCTKTLNGYAFGRAPPAPPATKGNGEEGKGVNGGNGAKGTRSERREGRVRDTTPAAAMVLMDMPGYGRNSREEWGVEIAKYLARRKMLRGAVVLVDAVAGVKDGDRMVLRLLRDADVRTAVVLTKADKLGYGLGGDGTRGVEEVGKMCEGVWALLRDLERGTGAWTEGKGWEREIWVTGAGDPRNGGLGVDGVRFAIARMAGLVEDESAGLPVVKKTPAQRIVPFEELRWSSGAGSATVEARA